MSLPPVHFYSIHASSMTLHAYVYNRANKVCTFLYYSITLCNPFSRAMYVKIKDHHPLQLVLTSRRFSHYLVVSLNTHTHISIAHTHTLVLLHTTSWLHVHRACPNHALIHGQITSQGSLPARVAHSRNHWLVSIVRDWTVRMTRWQK